ncbi:MAG: cyclase [Bacteroidetes bacterium MedPE-SWsnd-G1]|nr:MAG: cyclase [Bacteroidetes bacterium MedPE-SWsnd-G1]
MKNFLSLVLLCFLISCSEKTESKLRFSKIVDLSHDYSSETLYWVTAKEFKLDTVFAGTTDKGFYYTANNFETAEHGGTHIDAPIHFAENTMSVDQLPLQNLVGSAIKIDVTANAKGNPDYLINIDDFKTWENNHGMEIPDGSIVLLETGFSKFYPDAQKYLGTTARGEDAVKELHFPGLDPKAATWLVKNRNINAIGLDTPSIDYGQSTYFRSHVILLSENIPAFENLTSLDQLPPYGFNVVALPMKIKGGSGAPLRIIALLN